MYRLIDNGEFSFDKKGMIFKEYICDHYDDGEIIAIYVKAKHIVEMNKDLMSIEDINDCLSGGENYEWIFFIEEVEYCGGNEKMEERKMIKLKDVAEKYGEYKIDEDKLKEILIEPKPKTIWNLKENDNYYLIGDDDADIYESTWDEDEIDYKRLEIGNIFLTKEEAEFERERLKVETELLRYGGTRDMMSLGNYTKKWYMIYHHDSDLLEVGGCYNINHQGGIYFKSEEDSLNAINKIGKNRIKKYLFYVK